MSLHTAGEFRMQHVIGRVPPQWAVPPPAGAHPPLAFSHDAVVSGLCEAQLNPFNCQNPYLSSSKVSTAIRNSTTLSF